MERENRSMVLLAILISRFEAIEVALMLHGYSLIYTPFGTYSLPVELNGGSDYFLADAETYPFAFSSCAAIISQTLFTALSGRTITLKSVIKPWSSKVIMSIPLT